MKKFFSLVLALVMALSLTTVAWGATTHTVADKTELDALLAGSSLADGDTIQLTGDITGAVTITKSVTLDLNGKTISSSTDTISVTDAAVVLTIKDSIGTGKVTSDGDYCGAIYVKNGKVIIESGTFEGNYTGDCYAAYISTNGTLVVNGGTLKATGTGDDVYGVVVGTTVTAPATSCGATLEVNGGTISAPAGIGISGNGNWPGTTITIKGGTVTGGVAIYHPQDGALTISGGSISGDTGVYVKSGTVSVTGGTISATGAQGTPDYTGDGPSDTGDALVIDSCGYPGTLAVSVTGGYFSSTYAAAVASYAGNGVAAAEEEFIKGGTFDGAVAMDEDLVASDYRLVNGTVVAVSANTTDVVGGYQGMFTTAGATRQAVTNLTKTPAVAPLDLDEDGYYNRAGDRLGAIEYYTLNLGGAVAQNYYKVNTVDDADLIIYVGDSKTPYMYLANEPAGGFTYLTGAAVFTDFGKACGQFKWAAVDTTKTYYAYDGKVYVANPAGAVNLMVGTSFIQATDVTANGTWVAHVPVYTQDKTGAVTAIKCANCTDTAVIVANYAALPNTVKAAGAYFNVPGSASKMFYWVDGIVVPPSTDKTVTSAETFDAGIAMYVGMSVMAATGSAVVIGKKKD